MAAIVAGWKWQAPPVGFAALMPRMPPMSDSCLPEKRADLKPDVYGLRRIVPTARGIGWGGV
jgi:hypothetical protein